MPENITPQVAAFPDALIITDGWHFWLTCPVGCELRAVEAGDTLHDLMEAAGAHRCPISGWPTDAPEIEDPRDGAR